MVFSFILIDMTPSAKLIACSFSSRKCGLLSPISYLLNTESLMSPRHNTQASGNTSILCLPLLHLFPRYRNLMHASFISGDFKKMCSQTPQTKKKNVFISSCSSASKMYLVFVSTLKTDSDTKILILNYQGVRI